MRNVKNFIERRKHKRFKVKQGAFAVVTPDCNKLGQIKDISKGGLAFRYIAGAEKASASFEVDIFTAGNEFYLKKVPAKTVLDREADNKISFSSLPMRRMSMQFGKMISAQKSKLDYFLKNHTLDDIGGISCARWSSQSI